MLLDATCAVGGRELLLPPCTKVLGSKFEMQMSWPSGEKVIEQPIQEKWINLTFCRTAVLRWLFHTYNWCHCHNDPTELQIKTKSMWPWIRKVHEVISCICGPLSQNVVDFFMQNFHEASYVVKMFYWALLANDFCLKWFYLSSCFARTIVWKGQ